MPRVLFVDDDPAGLDLRRLIFERLGYEVLCASGPDEARLLFRKWAPPTVVVDLRLPEVEDGLSLIRDFRAGAPGGRIIALCGHPPDLEGTNEAALVDQILEKPVRSEKLIASVAGAS